MANLYFSNARAKSLENNLLGKDRLIRMCDSNSTDALKILSEVNFGESVLTNPLEFEKAIEIESQKLVDFIKENCPNKAFLLYFLIRNDYHNAEAFIKEKYLKIDTSELLVANGNIEKDLLKKYIFNDKYEKLPKNLAKALLSCDKLFVDNVATGQKVNTIFKKALYEDLAVLVKKIPELKEAFSIKVDANNISVALRTKDYKIAKEMFVTGGKLKDEQLKIFTEENVDTLKEKCKNYYCYDLICKAVDNMKENNSLSDFEKEADDYTLKTLLKHKYMNDGLYPFLIYCHYKKIELENVRIIMVGLNNGQSSENIARRLRLSYGW